MIDESRHFIAAILVRLGATLLIDLWALLPRRGFNIPLAGLLPVRTLAAPRAPGPPSCIAASYDDQTNATIATASPVLRRRTWKPGTR